MEDNKQSKHKKRTDLADVLEQGEKIEDKVDLLMRKEEIIADELEEVKKDEATLTSMESRRRNFVKKLAKHKFIFSMAVSLGAVLVWRGLWDITSTLPLLQDSVVALGLGVLILWFLERHTE